MKARDYTPLKNFLGKCRNKSHFVTTEKEMRENRKNWEKGIDRMIAYRKAHKLQ